MKDPSKATYVKKTPEEMAEYMKGLEARLDFENQKTEKQTIEKNKEKQRRKSLHLKTQFAKKMSRWKQTVPTSVPPQINVTGREATLHPHSSKFTWTDPRPPILWYPVKYDLKWGFGFR